MSGRSIKISKEVMNEVEAEAGLQNRSLSGQTEHWLKIGKIIEESDNFSYSRIKKTLEGEGSVLELSEEEQEIFYAEFGTHNGGAFSKTQEKHFQEYIKNH